MIISPNTIGKAMGASAIAGGGIGGLYGTVSKDVPTVADSAAVGAATGAAIIGTTAAVGTAGYLGVKNLDKVGSAAFTVTRGIGSAAFSVASGAGYLGRGLIDSLNSTSKLMNPIGHYANVAQKMAGSLVTYEPSETFWNPKKQIMDTKGGNMKLSGWGKMAVGMGAVAQGVFGAKKAFEESRMGTQDTFITKATPAIPSYANNGGASGDLVFALNANRRG